jgi:hypothetical protein
MTVITFWIMLALQKLSGLFYGTVTSVMDIVRELQ